MLSALLSTPQLLSPSRGAGVTGLSGDEVAATEQRVSAARRRSSIAAETRALDADGNDAPLNSKPTLQERRRSLGLPEDPVPSADSPTSEAAPIHPLARRASLSALGIVGSKKVLPYKLSSDQSESVHSNGQPEVPSGAPSNGLPLHDIPALLAGASSGPAAAKLLKASRAGFSSLQRGTLWPHVLVLPSSVTYVDIVVYYRAVESAFRLPLLPGGNGGALAHAAAKLAEAEGEGDEETIREAHQLLHSQLPMAFPAPPLLGRRAPFDFHAAGAALGAHDHAGDLVDRDAITAQQRILCVLSHLQGRRLTFAPQLAPVVSVLYHHLRRDEARTFAWTLALLERSQKDEQFLCVSPLSMELFVRGFGRLVEKHLPQLHDFLAEYGVGANAAPLHPPLVEQWFRQWSSDLFLLQLPGEFAARLCDVLVVAGFAPACYKMGLLVLAAFEPYILSASQPASGAAGAGELTARLAKLMSIANIEALLGSTGLEGSAGGAAGITWMNDAGFVANKNDLSKLTAPAATDVGIVIDAPAPSNLHPHASASSSALAVVAPPPLTLLSSLSAAAFHMPSFFAAAGLDAHERIMDTPLLHKLYSGILPAAAVTSPTGGGRDPICLHSSLREGHSISGLLSRILTHQSEAGDAFSGVLLLLQDSQGRVFGLYASRWPEQLLREEGATLGLEGEGFVVSFADPCQAKILRFGAPIAALPATSASAGEERVNAPEQAAVSDAKAASGPPESSVGTSLPILPVERPGQVADSPASSGVPVLKRRGSLAALLDVLHIKKAEEEPPEPRGPEAEAVMAAVPLMSPFRHPSVRLLLDAEKHAQSTRHSASAPSSPRAGSAASTASSLATTAAGSGATTPSLSRRASLVMNRAWNFIQSVPASSQSSPLLSSAASSVPASSNPSPTGSRRGSVSGAVTNGRAQPTNNGAAAVNMLGVASLKPAARQLKYNTMPAPGSPAASVRSVRGSGPSARSGSVIENGAQQHGKTLSAGFRPRASTLGGTGPPLSSLEQHLALQRARESSWDQRQQEQTGVAPSPVSRLALLPPPSPAVHAASPSNGGSTLPTISGEDETALEAAVTPSASEMFRALASPARAGSISAATSVAMATTPSGRSSPALPKHSSRASFSAKPPLLRSVSDVSGASGSTPRNSSIGLTSPPRAGLYLASQQMTSPQRLAHLGASSPRPTPTHHLAHVSVDGSTAGDDPLAQQFESMRAAAAAAAAELAGEADLVGPRVQLTAAQGLVLADPALRLHWTLSATLEEALLQCPPVGLPLTVQPIQLAIVEAWAFQ